MEQLRKQVTQAPSLTLTFTSILENIAPRVWWAAIVIIIEGPGLPSALLPISNAAALEKVYLEKVLPLFTFV